MKKNIIFKMQQVTKTFPGVIALDDVDFELLRGEVHVLLGENGAGKSTLVKIISGAYQKSSGHLFLDGREINIRSPKHAQKLGIGIIYQELNLVPHLSAAENIFLGREPNRIPGIIDQRQVYESAQKIIDELGVPINARSRIDELGIAQQQMVEVAKALSLNAKILIMDEPTSALTEQEIKELFTTIRRLKEKNVSIIYISHRLDELFEIGDRVTVLRDGTYIGTKNIQTITKAELIRMMVNRELKEQFPRQKTTPGAEVLRITNLNRKNILKNITLSLYQGEILGIAGLLGSGRTELARAIFGVDKIDSGDIHIKTERQKIKSPRSAIKLGIGFLTEDRKTQGLILNLSVKDNICLPGVDNFTKFSIVSTRKENSITSKFINELRIRTTGLNQKVMYLSGGNQQKVVLSKWLCSQADIFIFDEPTRGIDVGSKVEIYQLMNQLTNQGVAIIMISSDLPEILGMSDRILVMHQGKIKGEFLKGEATQESILNCAIG